MSLFFLIPSTKNHDNIPFKLFNLGGCIRLELLITFIDLFKMMTFIKFDRFLKTFIDFYRVRKCIDDFHRLLFKRLL